MKGIHSQEDACTSIRAKAARAMVFQLDTGQFWLHHKCHACEIHLPLRRQPRWWGSPALVMLKIAFNYVSKSPLGPLTFHQQLIKYFPFKDWLNFLAPKMKELLERRLKGTKRRGERWDFSRGIWRTFQGLHRNSAGFNFPAVFPLWAELPAGSKYLNASEKFNWVISNKPEIPNNGGRTTREEMRP